MFMTEKFIGKHLTKLLNRCLTDVVAGYNADDCEYICNTAYQDIVFVNARTANEARIRFKGVTDRIKEISSYGNYLYFYSREFSDNDIRRKYIQPMVRVQFSASLVPREDKKELTDEMILTAIKMEGVI